MCSFQVGAADDRRAVGEERHPHRRVSPRRAYDRGMGLVDRDAGRRTAKDCGPILMTSFAFILGCAAAGDLDWSGPPAARTPSVLGVVGRHALRHGVGGVLRADVLRGGAGLASRQGRGPRTTRPAARPSSTAARIVRLRKLTVALITALLAAGCTLEPKVRAARRTGAAELSRGGRPYHEGDGGADPLGKGRRRHRLARVLHRTRALPAADRADARQQPRSARLRPSTSKPNGPSIASNAPTCCPRSAPRPMSRCKAFRPYLNKPGLPDSLDDSAIHRRRWFHRVRAGRVRSDSQPHPSATRAIFRL